eukprot:1392035-Amorphochlora_amoeboformis.AAC.1
MKISRKGYTAQKRQGRDTENHGKGVAISRPMEGEAKEWWEGLGSSSEAQWGSLHVLDGSDHYHAKIWCDDNSFSLLLTDLKSVWGCRRRETEVDEDRERYAPRLRSDNDDQTLRKKTLELIQVSRSQPCSTNTLYVLSISPQSEFA